MLAKQKGVRSTATQKIHVKQGVRNISGLKWLPLFQDYWNWAKTTSGQKVGRKPGFQDTANEQSEHRKASH